MKIKILKPLKVRGKKSGLYNYQYFDSSDNPISAPFQDTETNIKNKQTTLKRL